MTYTTSKSPRAQRALRLLEAKQKDFAQALQELGKTELAHVTWMRDGGSHGGGHRYIAVETPAFNRIAINISGIHYDDLPDRRLASATALSTIIHPASPLAPSVHMHFSWTEMRDGTGYWRLMADLNPAIANDHDTARFADALQGVAPSLYDDAAKQGARYFHIPVLERHRGATHYYLEGHNSGDFDSDHSLVERICTTAMECYTRILGEKLSSPTEATTNDKAQQLAYHTLYLFQVLTLDRGTTSGLLVHDQNDLGIMGSLPAYVDRELLQTWVEHMPAPQDELLRALIECLGADNPSHVDDRVRLAFAQSVRAHYKRYPPALDMQARGDIVPPTVANHDAQS